MKKILARLRCKFNRLGPGFITGAADDDPSGIATYSIAGAQFGYKLNWLSLFLLPMMIALQEMCGRIGICSGMGLAGVIKKFYSKKLLIITVLLLFVSNVINIGADLGVMAASLEMIFGINFLVLLLAVTIFSVLMEVFLPYKRYSSFLKWLGLTLLVYVLTAFITKQDWPSVFYYTLIPHIDFNLPFLLTMVGFIGTTISPYLFFWQASEEVEEEIAKGRVSDFEKKPHVFKGEILHMQKDTTVGMIFSNLISVFIVLTAAAALNANGITDIETPQQVAMALRPLAGDFAYLLFTVGIIGIGLQSIPVLAGGVAYSVSETFGFKEGLSKKFGQARMFYIIIGLATVIGAVINLIGINPIRALYYSAIINGVISVPLIAIIIKLADDERIVGKYTTNKLNKVIGWVTFCFVGLSSLFMILGILMQ